MIEHYGYDATGNRTSFTNAGGTTSYTYPGTNHRLTQVGATARSYDNVGNTIQIGGTAKEFVYNDMGRMNQVKVSGTTTMNYQLNGKGEQVRKYLNANDTYTVYDEAGRWVGDYDSSGNALQQAIWLENLPIGLLASSQLQYLQPDHLGTPRTVIDPTSDVAIWTWELTGEAFGNTVPNQDPDGNGTSFVFNMRFPGQRYDSASGFNYNYFRDYDSVRGGYLQPDPTGQLTTTGLYSYASGRPFSGIDPYGLFNVYGYEVFNGSDYVWSYRFEFSEFGCKSAAALEVAGAIGSRASDAVKWARRISGAHDTMDAQPAGDAGVSDYEDRCRCLSFDPDLSRYFKNSLYGSENAIYSQHEAEGILRALRSEFYRLKREKCGPDRECRAKNEFYDWDDLLNRAQARGKGSIRHLRD